MSSPRDPGLGEDTRHWASLAMAGAQYPLPHWWRGKEWVTEHSVPWGNGVLLAEGVVLTASLPKNPPHCPSCRSLLVSAQGSSQATPSTCRALVPSPSQTSPWSHLAAPTPHSQLSCQQRSNLLRHLSHTEISCLVHGCPQSVRCTPVLTVLCCNGNVLCMEGE